MKCTVSWFIYIYIYYAFWIMPLLTGNVYFCIILWITESGQKISIWSHWFDDRCRNRVNLQASFNFYQSAFRYYNIYRADIDRASDVHQDAQITETTHACHTWAQVWVTQLCHHQNNRYAAKSIVHFSTSAQNVHTFLSLQPTSNSRLPTCLA